MIDKANKKLKERLERMDLLAEIQTVNLNQNRHESRRDREQNLIKENKLLLGKMLREELEPKNFDELDRKENSMSENCTICLEDFKKDEKVVSLLCKHIFHFFCLNDWLTQNILSPKCPNCNHFVIEERDKIDKDGVAQSVNYWQFRQQTVESRQLNERNNRINRIIESIRIEPGARQNIDERRINRTLVMLDNNTLNE